MHLKKFVSSGVLQAILIALVAAGCLTLAANAQTVYNNGTGYNNGYYYSLYTSGGSAQMTFPGAGNIPAITPSAGKAWEMWLAAKAGKPAAR